MMNSSAFTSRVADHRRPAAFALSALLAGGVACSGVSTPTQPTPPPPSITCAANVDETPADGRPAAVTYSAPTTSGGFLPLIVTCTPASGSTFPIGTTTVTCSVTDQVQRVGTCSLTVTLRVPPYVEHVKYLAFGDSLTEGEDGSFASSAQAVGPRVIVPPDRAYPGYLNRLLTQRYTAQPDIVVTNAGRSGEITSEGSGRLPQEIRNRQPDVLLLLEGANDINNNPAGVARAATNLRAMVRDAFLGRGVVVMLATLPPQIASRFRGGGAPYVAPLNAEIRRIAAEERGVVLVDLFAAFGTDESLISGDGLHPNESGFQRMAETFYAAIRENFEVPFPGTSPATSRRFSAPAARPAVPFETPGSGGILAPAPPDRGRPPGGRRKGEPLEPAGIR
jgi:lysophospholipase L1-like esterase